jgi:hypothetical protein
VAGFSLVSGNNSPEEEEPIISVLESPYQLEPSPQRFKQSEIQTVINNLFPKTSPGYDLITGKILQELPPAAIKFITQLFNASLILGYVPDQWQVAQIILILKPANLPMFLHPIVL